MDGTEQRLRVYRDGNGRSEGIKFVGELRGWRLNAASSLIYSNLSKEKIKMLRSKREAMLSEEEGIRLALIIRGVSALKDVFRTARYASGVYELSREEAYYWFAETSNNSGRRGIRALRILLGGVK